MAIAAARNLCAPESIPFLFGGDGAVLMVPPQHQPAVRQALARVRGAAWREHGLRLRVGMVPVSALRTPGLRRARGALRADAGQQLRRLCRRWGQCAGRRHPRPRLARAGCAGRGARNTGRRRAGGLERPVLPLGTLAVAARQDADADHARRRRSRCGVCRGHAPGRPGRRPATGPAADAARRLAAQGLHARGACALPRRLAAVVDAARAGRDAAGQGG